MALDDRQHVEAVGILRRFVEWADAGHEIDAETYMAAKQWLRENHPEPSVYIAALSAALSQPTTEAPRG